MKKCIGPAHHVALVLLAALMLAPPAYAQTGSWNVDANGLWSTATNWLSDTIADGSGSTANFTNDITADRTVSLDSDRTLTNVVFGDSDTSSAGSWILNNNSLSTNNLILAGTTPTITVNALGTGRTATISAIIEGTAGLTKAGTGTLILSGVNTYTGTTVVNAGELRLGVTNALGPGDLTVNTGGTVSMGNFTDTVGTIRLNRGSILFGNTTSLKTGTGGFITTGGIVNNWPGIGLGGNFSYNTDGGNETTASIGAIDFNGGSRVFTVADGVQAIDVEVTVSLYDPAAGNRNFTKSGAGTMRISGSTNANYNLGSGTTSINDGVLQLNKSTGFNAVGGSGLVTVGDSTGAAGSAILRYVGGNDQIPSNAITVNSDGLFDLADKTDTVGTVTLQGGSITSTTGVLTSNAAYAFQSGSASARLAGSIGLNKTTTGTATLSGDNSYTGVTTISAGAITITHANALGSTAGNTTVAATGSNSGGVLQLSGGITTPENITITGTTEAGSFFGAIRSMSGTNTVSGNVTLAGSGSIRLEAAGGNLIVSGNITQSGTTRSLILEAESGRTLTVNNAIANNGGALITDLPGTVILNGVSGSGIGNTTMFGGTLKMGVADALNTTRPLELYSDTSAPTFDLAGFNQTINALASSGTGAAANRKVINSVVGISTLTVGNGGGSGTFNGQINTGTGNIQLIKTGVGNQTLSGNNSFTGGTRIDAGTLTLGHATDTLATGGAIEVNGGTLALNANSDTVGAVTLKSGSITSTTGVLTGASYAMQSGSVAAILGGSAVALTKSTSGTVTLSGVNTYTGATSVDAGTLFVNGSLAAGSAVSVGANGTLGGTGTINGAATIFGAHTPGNSPGSQTFASNLTYSGGSSAIEWELVGNTITNAANPNAVYDQILVNGSLDFAGATSLNLVFNGAGSSVLWANPFWDADQQWTLYDVAGSTTNFGNLSLAAGSYVDSGSNPLALARPNASFNVVESGSDVVVSYVAVPEPTTIGILGTGVALLGLRVARRRKA